MSILPWRIDLEILPAAVSARQGSPTDLLQKAIGPRNDRGTAAAGLANRNFTRTIVTAAAVPDGRGSGAAPFLGEYVARANVGPVKNAPVRGARGAALSPQRRPTRHGPRAPGRTTRRLSTPLFPTQQDPFHELLPL